MMESTVLAERTIADLRSIAKNYHIPNYWNLKKHDLIQQLVSAHKAQVAKADLSQPQPISDDSAAVGSTSTDSTPAAAVVETPVGTSGIEDRLIGSNGVATLLAESPETAATVEAAVPAAPEVIGDTIVVSVQRAEPVPEAAPQPAEVVPEEHIFVHGVLDIAEAGHGFLRSERYLPGPDDVYVSQSQIRRFGLRTGDLIAGQMRPPKDNERFYSLLRVEAVNGQDPEQALRRPIFENLTPIFPQDQLNLETTQQNLAQRLMNLVAPVGRGQRGLIVSPPKAGKTMLLKQVANGITINHPDIYLMVCLIGERPEEVTDMKRSVQGEVISSTFDEDTENHTRVAEMALERAKRLVESGRDVVILLDSITRLVRAYNLAVPPSGRTLTGGVDPSALYPPKRFYGAARNLEEGGSLTILATCLIDTGSRMDEVIYEEFKGTGNLEIHLDRRLAERRVFPAIDVLRSSTRREELLLDEATLRQVWVMRRMLQQIGDGGYEQLLRAMSRTTNNREFLRTITKDSL